MSVITPTQSREARRELGISQADVAGAINVNRVYISDFESGNLIRLTNVQLRKLRAFYEGKIEEARTNGDEILVTFGEDGGDNKEVVAGNNLSPKLSKRSIEQNVFEIDSAVPDDVVLSAKKLIGQCSLEIMPLLEQKAAAGFLSDFDEKTEKTLQQVFGQLSLVGLLFIQMTSPGVFRVSPPKDDMKVVYDVVFETFKERLIEAGLIIEGQANATNAAKEEEAAK